MPISGLSRKLDIGAVIAAYVLSSGMLYALIFTDGSSIAQTATTGMIVPQILWSIVYLYILIRALQNGNAMMQITLSNKPLLLLPLLACSSFLWSQAPFTAIRRSIALLFTYLLGAFIALKFTIRQQLVILSGVLLIAACASYAAELIFPGAIQSIENIPGTWHGVFDHKNHLSQMMLLCVLALACLLALQVRYRTVILSGIAFCLGLVVLSRSATGIVVGLGLFVSYIIIRTTRGSGKTAIIRLCIIGVLAAGASLYVSTHSDDLLRVLGKSNTLTGRTDIWAYSLLSVAKRPLLGYGYSTFWHVSDEAINVRLLLANHWDTPGAHNGYIEVLLELGVVGLVLLVYNLLAVLARCVRLSVVQRDLISIWPLMLTLFLIGSGFSENTLLLDNSLFWFLFTTAAFGTYRRSFLPK
jgi:O-antigen ligase